MTATPLLSQLASATHAAISLSERVGFDLDVMVSKWGIEVREVTPVQAEALSEVIDGDWRDLVTVRAFHSFGSFQGVSVDVMTGACPKCRHCDSTAFDSTDEDGALCVDHARAASSRHDEQEAAS